MDYLSQKDLERLQNRFSKSKLPRTRTFDEALASIKNTKPKEDKPLFLLSKHERNINLDLENNTITVVQMRRRKSYPLVVTDNKYIFISVKGHVLLLHRLVWMLQNGEIPEGTEVDHIDRNKGNNHPSNLRLATKSENAQNRTTRSDNKLGVKGVSYDPPTGKYRAEITVNKKTIRLGRFLTLEAAVKARKDAEVLHHTHRVT